MYISQNLEFRVNDNDDNSKTNYFTESVITKLQ